MMRARLGTARSWAALGAAAAVLSGPALGFDFKAGEYVDGSLITESGHLLNAVKDLSVESVERGYLVLRSGSGMYHFSITQ